MFVNRGKSLGAAIERKLFKAGVVGLDDLLALNEREVLMLPGVGPGTVRTLAASLDEHGLRLAEDPFAAYLCARESKVARDAELRAYFLCDGCRNDYAHLAFSDTAPEWISGEKVDGYCGNCNELTSLRLSQWFLCGNCDRIMRSIGRGVASQKYVTSEWAGAFAGQSLALAEVDPVELRPWMKRSDPSRVASADFVASEDGTTVLGLELKTGRSGLPGGGVGSPMARFQLDTTDCDDITAAARGLAAPVFLIHAQVIGRAHAPTERYVGVGLWFARPWDLLPHLETVQRRPRETRDAAYFRTAAFRPFSEFPAYVQNRLEDDLELMRTDGFPILYRR